MEWRHFVNLFIERLFAFFLVQHIVLSYLRYAFDFALLFVSEN